MYIKQGQQLSQHGLMCIEDITGSALNDTNRKVNSHVRFMLCLMTTT